MPSLNSNNINNQFTAVHSFNLFNGSSGTTTIGQQFQQQQQQQQQQIGQHLQSQALNNSEQAGAVASAFKTRANTEGSLALGSQGRETALQLEQARTLGDLTKIKAQTKAQLAIKQFGANQALAGQRFFA
jgi:ethanolamine ammonia-lyase small subunit